MILQPDRSDEMAEIRLERKEGKGWLWSLLAVVALVVLAWWFFNRNDAVAAAGSSDSTGVAAAYNRSGVPVAGGGAEAFLAWVATNDTARTSDGNLSHEYTATGIRRLADAIGSIARGDSLGGSQLADEVSALTTLAGQLQTEPQSLKHADLTHAAFAAAAQLLQDVQRRNFPNASAQVSSVREAADAVSKARPLLEQRTEINRFFASAAEAVRALR